MKVWTAGAGPHPVRVVAIIWEKGKTKKEA